MQSTVYNPNMQSSNAKNHTTKNPVRKYFIENFLSSLNKDILGLKPTRILDLGCGEGFVIKNLKKAMPETKFTGVDISSEAIEVAKKEIPEGKFYNLDISNLGMQNSPLEGSYDMVMCLEVLEHIPEYDKAIKNIKKIEAEYFIFSVPNEPFFRLGNLMSLKNVKLLGNDPEHVNNWTFLSFKKLMRKHFEVISCSYPFPWQMLICKKKQN